MLGDEQGSRSGPLLLVWAPSRLLKELRAFAVPELQEQYQLASQAAARAAEAAPDSTAQPPPPPPGRRLPQLPFKPCGDGLLAELADDPALDVAALAAAAQQCTLLTAAVQQLATAGTAEELAAQAQSRLADGTAGQHQLRVLPMGGVARAPAQRFLRQQLQQLGLGTAPAPGQPPLWCIQRPQPGLQAASTQPSAAPNLVLGLELAAGRRRLPGRHLGPTAMLPELAAVSAGLAAVRPGSVALDPFCGSGSLLVAALHRGAALALGSDIDATHFDAGSSSGAVLMQADATRLHTLLPAGTVDAVLTDLPYGYRTDVAVGGAAAAAAAGAGGADGGGPAADGAGTDSWQQLLQALLQLGSHVLVPGGRLLVWMPNVPCSSSSSSSSSSTTSSSGGGNGCEPQLTAQWPTAVEAPPQLRLLHFLPETRQAGYPRAVALFERQQEEGSSDSSDSSSAGRTAALLEAVGGAAALGTPVWGLPSGPADAAEQQRQQQPEPAPAAAALTCVDAALDSSVPAAVQQRGIKYKHVRRAAAGAAMDVWRAAWLGDAAAIEEYAAAGGDVNARDRKLQTPLQFAAGYGKTACVELLLRLGADPSAAADRSGMAALHRAAARNHSGALGLLLAVGASPWQRSAAGQTPLMYAAQFGHADVAQLLLEHLAALQQEQHHCAAGAAAASAAAPGGLREYLALSDAAGLSALHLAAQWGMDGLAAMLLEAGADPNQPSACQQGLAPAHLAARWGHPAALRVLQRHGADLQRPDARGWTPLQEALEWRRAECVDVLQGLAGGGSAADGS